MITVTEVNVPLLRKTLEHITAHPKEWDQRWWASRSDCGTAYCMAGWAVRFAHPNAVAVNYVDTGYSDGTQAAQHVVIDGERHDIERAARRELGLSETEGNELFAPYNSITKLWKLASGITAGEIEVDPSVERLKW
jgi:hypothetical protein